VKKGKVSPNSEIWLGPGAAEARRKTGRKEGQELRSPTEEIHDRLGSDGDLLREGDQIVRKSRNGKRSRRSVEGKELGLISLEA